MENLNAEQVKEWLEICAEDTPYPDQSQALLEALALITSQEQRIKELTEENERLRKLATVKEVEKEIVRKETRADTARKMQERLKEKIHKSVYQYWNDGGGGYYLAEDVDDDIDQIAKEMLEGEK